LPKKKTITGIFLSIFLALLIALIGGEGYNLVLPVLYIFLLHWVFFFHAYVLQTEHYFDAIGSLTFISLSLIALYFFRNIYSVIIGIMVITWALRLGSFLFTRVKEVGKDSRFTEMKKDFLWFLMTWSISGLWVFLTYAAGLNAMISSENFGLYDLGLIEYLGIIVGFIFWISGFLLEVISDQQKRTFRKNPENLDKFIVHGLWAWSRHPNYFGEILLWFGIAIIALPTLEGWRYITLISPLFVYLLLTRVSGLPMLESAANKKWGDNPKYLSYKKNTPLLVLRKPKNSERLIGNKIVF